MSPGEARSLLGVSADATPQEINTAWKRLMGRAHPDQGGTEGLASRLNAARDRLLKG
jgi:curved DNA-binding protein CbpA